MTVVASSAWRKRFAWAARVFAAALALQAFHSVEHVAQVVQKHGLGRAEAHGLLGALFDTEWVHFVYNGALLALVVGVAWLAGRESLGRWRVGRPVGWWLLAATIAVQGYHFIEHAVRLGQHLATGVEPAPGILGRVLDLTWLHFGINAGVYALMLGAFAALGVGRCPGLRRWTLGSRTPAAACALANY